jgi:hypothetical protein
MTASSGISQEQWNEINLGMLSLRFTYGERDA